MKKIIPLIIVFLCGCGNVNDEALFKKNIIDPIPGSVQNITVIKDRSAMHGALLFEFDANKNAITEIIKNNQLEKLNKLPIGIQSLIDKAPQWVKGNNTDIYGTVITDDYSGDVLYVFADGNNVCCIKIST